jgi:hypothetical protein
VHVVMPSADPCPGLGTGLEVRLCVSDGTCGAEVARGAKHHMRRRIHACRARGAKYHMRRRIYACHVRRRIPEDARGGGGDGSCGVAVYVLDAATAG